MAGLVAFEGGVVEVGEYVGGERVVVDAGIGGEGGAELADEVAESGSVEAEEGAGADEEGVRVPEGGRRLRAGRRRRGEGDGLGGDVPAAVRPAAGPEAEAAAVVEGQGPRVAGGGRGGGGADDLLVGELGEHLGEQAAGGKVPGGAGEFGRRAGVLRRRGHGGFRGVGGCGEIRHGTPRRSGTLLRDAEFSKGEAREEKDDAEALRR